MCAVLSVLFKTIQIKAIQNFAILFVSCVLRNENIFHMSFYIGTNGVAENWVLLKKQFVHRAFLNLFIYSVSKTGIQIHHYS